jgi:hypothetical protein
VDYTKITADIVRGPEIGKLYVEASPFITTLARQAYRQLADQVDQQYRVMRDRITIHFQKEDPYAHAEEMFADVTHNGRLKVYMTEPGQSHPLLTMAQNDRFRAVHDYYGHYMTGRGFDRHGEEAAWVSHSQMFTGLARRAMTTETRGQSSAFIWINGGRRFPEQKAILLPDWCSEIPERWS